MKTGQLACRAQKESTFAIAAVSFGAASNPLPAVDHCKKRWKGVRQPLRLGEYLLANSPASYLFGLFLLCEGSVTNVLCARLKLLPEPSLCAPFVIV